LQFEQRIEASNSYDLAGSNVTISANISNSLLTTVSWILYYANVADNFSANTLISSGNWTVSSTISRYNATVAVPAAATTGLYLMFVVGAQTSGTFKIGDVQLEAGSTATDFERRPIGTELALCQRYYSKSYDLNIAVGASGDPVGGLEYFLAAFSAQTGNLGRNFTFPVSMRATPTVTTYDRSSPPNSGKVTTNGGGNKTANQIAVGQRSTTIYASGSSESELTFHWAAAAEL
jgi:hypothetical protein